MFPSLEADGTKMTNDNDVNLQYLEGFVLKVLCHKFKDERERERENTIKDFHSVKWVAGLLALQHMGLQFEGRTKVPEGIVALSEGN